MLQDKFFARDAITVAKELLGKVIRVKYRRTWLSAIIIETEAYYIHDKASHASLGYTEKRKALFMPPGTIYMYYSRAGDSFNVSCLGDGNAVLIKAAYPYTVAMNEKSAQKMVAVMQELYVANTFNRLSSRALQKKSLPSQKTLHARPMEKLCAGQSLLCRSLGLKVKDWDQKQFSAKRFYIEDVGYQPKRIIQTKRLGIKLGRDEHLPYRFIDAAKAQYCTDNPLRKKIRT